MGDSLFRDSQLPREPPSMPSNPLTKLRAQASIPTGPGEVIYLCQSLHNVSTGASSSDVSCLGIKYLDCLFFCSRKASDSYVSTKQGWHRAQSLIFPAVYINGLTLPRLPAANV